MSARRQEGQTIETTPAGRRGAPKRPAHARSWLAGALCACARATNLQ